MTRPHDSKGPEQRTADVVTALIRRELRTLARTRTFLVLGVAFTAIVLGIGLTSGSVKAGYVPMAADLLTPLELLVPVVSIAFGYRAILGDAQRGELDILRTYPISHRELVLGTYIGRAIGLLGTVSVPLFIVGGAVFVGKETARSTYASHAAIDSPVLFGRFVVVTVIFALAILAVAIAISSAVNGTRSALALSVVALVVVLVGFDLALVYGYSGGFIRDSGLLYSLSVSPLSAYRGLVFDSVVMVSSGAGPAVASPITSLLSVTCWTVGSLGVSVWALNR